MRVHEKFSRNYGLVDACDDEMIACSAYSDVFKYRIYIGSGNLTRSYVIEITASTGISYSEAGGDLNRP